MANYYVDTDGVSQTYASLADALAALPTTFTEDYHIYCVASTGVADTKTIGAATYNTTASYRLYIHGSSSYRLEFSNADRWYIYHATSTSYLNITVTGVRFIKAAMSANYQQIIFVSGLRNGQLRLIGNTFIGANVDGTYRDRMIDLDCNPTYSYSVVMVNNIIIGRSTSASTANSVVYNTQATRLYAYYNTLKGHKASGAANANAIWKNNIIKTTVASDSVSTSSNYNMHSGAFTMGGANDQQGRTFSFVDESNFDFHLSPSDTGAKNAGISLSGDSLYPVTTDADGVTREDPPDAGAFELIEQTAITGSVTQDALTGDQSISGSIFENLPEISGTVSQDSSVSSQEGTGTVTDPSILIIDHNVVALYSDIPEEYKTAIKQKWLSVPGESHSGGYRTGLALLEALDPSFAVNVAESGTPEMPTSSYLRASRATWGDLTHATGWRYEYGEEDWFTSAAALAQTKTFLQYAHDQGFGLSAVGFGWCWDETGHNAPTTAKDPVYKCGWAGSSVGGPEGDLPWGLDAADSSITGNSVCMDTYLNATQEFIDYCAANSINTKVFFTTGPVDNLLATENAYQRFLKHERIRDYVNTNGGILFDYADILCWDDAGNERTTSWTDGDGGVHTFQHIAADNLLNLDGSDGSGNAYHIGERGALRLGKALWVMLAMADGWEGSDRATGDVSIDSPASDQSATGFLVDPIYGIVSQESSSGVQDISGNSLPPLDFSVTTQSPVGDTTSTGSVLPVLEFAIDLTGSTGNMDLAGSVADPLLDIDAVVSLDGNGGTQSVVGAVQQIPLALIDISVEEGPYFVVGVTEEGSTVSTASPIMLEAIEELSAKVITVSFSYMNGTAIPTIPKTLTWSLRDLNDAVVNGRENVPISVIGTSVSIVLSGEDLNIDGSGELRKLVLRGTYDSELGNDLPFTKEIRFPVLKVSGL